MAFVVTKIYYQFADGCFDEDGDWIDSEFSENLNDKFCSFIALLEKEAGNEIEAQLKQAGRGAMGEFFIEWDDSELSEEYIQQLVDEVNEASGGNLEFELGYTRGGIVVRRSKNKAP